HLILSSVTPLPHPSFHPPSLHDALPILTAPPHKISGPAPKAHPWVSQGSFPVRSPCAALPDTPAASFPQFRDSARRNFLFPLPEDRKSTRLNSSHVSISYAVFCLKKKNQ